MMNSRLLAAAAACCLGLNLLNTSLAAADSGAPHGFYSVHRLKNGVFSAKPGDVYLGKGIHLAKESRIDPSSGQVEIGLSGAFSSFGRITTRTGIASGARGEATLVWHDVKFKDIHGSIRRIEYSGPVALAPVPEPASGDLFLTIVGHPDYLPQKHRSFRLKRIGDSLGARPTEMISRRGVSYFPPFNSDGIFPPNSIEAFDEALRQGFAGFELDVRLSSDVKWIVSYNEDISIASDCTGLTHEKSLAELEECNLDASPLLTESHAIRSKFQAKMPSLKEVFRRYFSTHAGSRLKKLVIDIKPSPDREAIAAFLDAAMAAQADPAAIAPKLSFVSRSKEMIVALREHFPGAEFALEGATGMKPPLRKEEHVLEAGGGQKQFHDTISSRIGLSMNERAFEDLDTLLTDAPYSRIARIQLGRYF